MARSSVGLAAAGVALASLWVAAQTGLGIRIRSSGFSKELFRVPSPDPEPGSASLRRRPRADSATRACRQINRSNVATLQVAWSYDTGEPGGLQTQPLVVDGVALRLHADAQDVCRAGRHGRVLWTFDAAMKSTGPNRGVMYWAVRRRPARLRVGRPVSSTRSMRGLGSLIPAFGERRAHRPPARSRPRSGDAERPPDARRASSIVTLLILGGRVNEGLPGSPGHIRALRRQDGRAALDLPHHSASRVKRDYETWSKESWTYNGGANSWPGMALDEARGIVYRPHRVGVRRFLRRQSTGRQPLRQRADRAERGDREAHLALPVRAPRHLGSRSAVAADAGDGQTGWQDDRRRRSNDEARVRVRVRSRDRQAALSNRGAPLPAERRPWGTSRRTRNRFRPSRRHSHASASRRSC